MPTPTSPTLWTICNGFGPQHIEALLRKWLKILPNPRLIPSRTRWKWSATMSACGSAAATPTGRSRRVHCHDPHPGLPLLAPLVKPVGDRLLRPPAGLPEQAGRAGEVDEVGLETLQLDPHAAARVRGLPRRPRRRVSSMPSPAPAPARTAPRRPGPRRRRAPPASSAWCARTAAPTDAPPSTTATAAWRSRPVTRAPAGSSGMHSVNAVCGQASSPQRYCHMYQRTANGSSP